MTPQSTRSYTKLAAATVVAAVIISAALLASSSFRTTVTTTVYETTSSSSSTSLITDTTASCETPGLSLGVQVHIANGSEPVAGAHIAWQSIASCNGSAPMVIGLSQTSTNSSGWAWMCSEYIGTCALAITYSGQMYSLSIPLQNWVITDVHYDLSTGNETLSTCGSGGTPCH